MPRLSDSMEEGVVLKWLKQVGDEVAVGDELVEIETDKANMAYEADVAGTLTEILAAGGRGVADREPDRHRGRAGRRCSGGGRKGTSPAGRGSCRRRGPTTPSGS